MGWLELDRGAETGEIAEKKLVLPELRERGCGMRATIP